jgi:hypothetical protein
MQFRLIAGFIVVLAFFLLNGWGTAPQISASNRKILEAVQTAVSAKKLEWLEAVETQVTQKHAEGDVSDGEYHAIDAIITKARSGDWKGAQRDSFALSEAQRPTSDDLEMLKNRQSRRT